jgi:2-amino-4-hydroxy-6-hydroxymethyldihydropteridine diphosphokinase
VKPVSALLLLGANLGDRGAALRRAVAALRRVPGLRVRALSRVYETAPVGPSDRPYLNRALRATTTRTAMGLLLEAKTLEAAAGRRPGRRWGARVLDVDLIAYGAVRRRTPWLSVPHPRVAQRAFALAPLADVAPRWRPDGRRTVASLLAALNPDAAAASVKKSRP